MYTSVENCRRPTWIEKGDGTKRSNWTNISYHNENFWLSPYNWNDAGESPWVNTNWWQTKILAADAKAENSHNFKGSYKKTNWFLCVREGGLHRKLLIKSNMFKLDGSDQTSEYLSREKSKKKPNHCNWLMSWNLGQLFSCKETKEKWAFLFNYSYHTFCKSNNELYSTTCRTVL